MHCTCYNDWNLPSKDAISHLFAKGKSWYGLLSPKKCLVFTEGWVSKHVEYEDIINNF